MSAESSTTRTFFLFIDEFVALLSEIILPPLIFSDSAAWIFLLGKYIYAAADAKAVNAINQGNVNDAVQSYINAAENPLLEPELKQQSYYIAAYLCSMTGSADASVITDYLQKAIDAAPESEEVASIQKIMEMIR